MPKNSAQQFLRDIETWSVIPFFVFGILFFYANFIAAIIAFTLLMMTMSILYYKKPGMVMRLLQKKISLFSIKGIRNFYPYRKDLNSVWKKYFIKRRTPREVIFMGQALSKTFEVKEQAEAFVKWCNENVSIKILLLSPSAANSVQLRRIGEELTTPTDKENVAYADSLKLKIIKSIEIINKNLINKISDINKKPLLRFSKIDLPYSIIAIDDEMFITFYGTEAEADNQPTLKIIRKKSEAFTNFMKEFENIWNNFSTVTPYPDPILKAYSREWKRCIELKKSYDDRKILKIPPRQAIIFPTYECSNHCVYCMYKNLRIGGEYINFDDLKDIICQLVAYGVENIEISGGGEPLEYKNFADLCQFLFDLNKDKKLKFGLLTNGINIHQYKEIAAGGKNINLLDVFNEYIRVSRLNKYSEGEGDSEFRTRENKWKENVWYLINLKKRNQTKYQKIRIGLKYLLTNTNKNAFIAMVADDLSANLINDVDHSRFRSAREVAPETISDIEQKVYYLLCSNELVRVNFKKKIALSLPHTHYPANFKCWISPMHVVITPKKEVYSCCNFSVDNDDTLLGILDTKKFVDIWESEDHLEKRRKLGGQICSCEDYCTNCRYAELQQIMSTATYDLLDEI